MNSLKQIRDQLLALWNRSSRSARATYVAVGAGCLALIIGVGIWSSRPQFVPLATDLDPTTMGNILNVLDAQKIEYQLNFSGSTVLVPKKDFNRARIQVADVAGQHLSQSETPSSSLWDDPRDHQRKERERQEQQIASMLERMDAIDQATVKIAKPGKAIYASEQKNTSAAVVLTLNPRYSFGRSDAYNVARLVADGVEELDIKNVSVSDHTNRLLYTGSSAGLSEVTNHLEYKRSVESERAANAQQMLTKILGDGRAIVRVNADIDFTVSKRRGETPDPDSKVAVKEKIQSFEGTGAIRRAIGAAGTSSNVTSPPSSGQLNDSGDQKGEYSEIEYLPGKTIDETTQFGGTVERLTVAATVDFSNLPADSGAAITKAEIEELIKDAVGFDSQRGDKITLLVGKIAGDPPVDQLEVGVPWWQRYERLARSLSLGVAALVAFVIGLLIVRKLRPIAVEKAADPSDRRRTDLVSELSAKARQNPEAVSRILAAWLNDPGRNEINMEDDGRESLVQPTRRAA